MTFKNKTEIKENNPCKECILKCKCVQYKYDGCMSIYYKLISECTIFEKYVTKIINSYLDIEYTEVIKSCKF